MSRINRIKEILEKEFSPTQLEIIDDSSKHVHHHTNPGGEETHLTVSIVSTHFEKKTSLQRHRAVNQALRNELQSGLHALKLHTRTPKETL